MSFKNKFLSLLFALTLSVSVIGCGGDGTGNSKLDGDGMLSAEEQATISNFLLNFSSLNATAPTVGGPLALMAQVTNIACPDGGSIDVFENSIEYAACNIGLGNIINGTVSFSQDGDGTVTFNYETITFTDGSNTTTFSGTVSINADGDTITYDNLAITTNGETVTMDGAITIADAGSTISYDSFTLDGGDAAVIMDGTIMINPDGSIDGTLTFSDGGGTITTCVFNDFGPDVTEADVDAACGF